MFFRKILFVLILFWITAVDVYGNERANICYWQYDNDSNVKYVMKEIELENDMSVEQRVEFIFQKFFDRNDDDVNFIPENTEFINADLNDGNLDLYVSSDIKSYGGGCAWEIALVNGILYTAFDIPEVQCVTLYMGGNIDFLPEGILIDGYRREDFLIE